MPHRPRSLRWLAPALMALALALPPHALAQSESPPPSAGGTAGSDSIVGALLAVACGASINVARAFPHPYVIATAIGSCVGAFLDAVLSPD